MSVKRLLALFILLVLMGCERPTAVRLEYANGLFFDITGDGSVGQLTVFGPRHRDEASSPSDERFVFWRIEPINGYLNGPRISQLKKVKYGSVPVGYKQVIPADARSPEPLISGNSYLLLISTVGATGFGKWFTVANDRVQFVNLTGPCFHDDHGRWTRVNCTD
jgi:hypothetical protein